MKKMFVYNLMDMSVLRRLEISIMINFYNFSFNKDKDFKNELFFKGFTDDQIKEFISSYDLLIINNGYRPAQGNFVNVAKSLNKKTIFTELGHLPQKGYIHLDYNGLYHEDSLCFDDLSWINEDDVKLAKQYLSKSIYAGFLENQEENYILCPFQLDFDSSLVKSKLKNTDLINFVIKKYSNEKIIFKMHPRHSENDKKNILSKYKDIEIGESQSFLELAKNAKKIVGMSSTCLVESLAINKDVEAIAECPIYFAAKNNKIQEKYFRDKLTTAYVLSQYRHDNIEEAKKCVDLLIKRAKYTFD